MRSPEPSISLLFALVGSTIAGCSLVGWGAHPKTPPTVRLVASTVTDLSESEIAATVVVSVSNPNPEPVRVGRVRYRLTFPGGGESTGAVNANTSVPGGGSLDVELPVRISIRRLLPGAAPMLLMGELPYDLEVGVGIGMPLLGTTIDVQASSALRLDLPLELVRSGSGRELAPRFEFAAHDWQTRDYSQAARRLQRR